MSLPLLRIDEACLSFGGSALFTKASLSVAAGDKIALVGRNGAGKSTLLKVVVGSMELTKGEIFKHPRCTIAYLSQQADFSGFTTIFDYVSGALNFNEDLQLIYMLLEQLGLEPNANLLNLSGGEARRVALAKVLVQQPDILLLDEPTNHLDLVMIEWLEKFLLKTKSAYIIISHDRRFLQNTTTKTIWLDRGVTHNLDKGFAAFEDWRDQKLQEEELAQHKLSRQIAREEDWLRYGVSARRKRNVRRLHDLYALRQKFKSHREIANFKELDNLNSETSGKAVIEAKNLTKGFYNKVLVKDFSIRILRGEKIGLIGGNGVGKTTLLNLLTKQMPPDSGSVKLGSNLDIAILSQQRKFEEGETVKSYITDGRGGTHILVNGEEKHIAAYLKDFLFAGEQLTMPVSSLSGGEKARLMLARLLSRPANFFILDEPTNDLDLETLDVLQEIIVSFKGTVLLVSHDRDFLDKTVTRVIAAEGAGLWLSYAGGYSDMVAQRSARQTEITSICVPAKASVKKNVVKLNNSSNNKLSYKQKYALEQIPKDLDAIIQEITVIETKLNDHTLYGADIAKAVSLSKQLIELQDRKLKLEEEWLELEMLREQLEDQ